MPYFKKHLHQKKRVFTKRNLLILGVFVGLMIALLVGKNLYDTYHDRPFAQGLQYVGRDYSSGCAPLRLLCFGPETEQLYYATDIEPGDIVKLLPGWTLQATNEGNVQLWDGSASTERGYRLISTTGAYSAYGYMLDKAAVSSVSHLLPTNKKYIIEVSREDYTLLRQSVSR